MTDESSKDFQVPQRVAGSSDRVAVGVSGHRALADLASVAEGVERALREILKQFAADHFTIISSLAEGADRLVARIAVEGFGARLVVVLPLSQADYETDFDTEDSKGEFRELLSGATEVVGIASEATRELAYESAGREMLARCDVLIAVWDGELPRGRGGTGAVVEDGRRRKLPIAWVHAGNSDQRTSEPTSAGPAQGLVTFENFPARDQP